MKSSNPEDRNRTIPRSEAVKIADEFSIRLLGKLSSALYRPSVKGELLQDLERRMIFDDDLVSSQALNAILSQRKIIIRLSVLLAITSFLAIAALLCI